MRFYSIQSIWELIIQLNRFSYILCALAVLSYTINRSFVGGRLLQDGFHHCVAKLGCLRETWGEVFGNVFKTVTVGLKVTERDTLGPCLVRMRR